MLLARRPESGGALWPELTRGFASDGLQAVTMDPLGLGATRRLLASVLSSPIGRPLLQRVHEASGGNPLYALAIVRELEKQGSGGHGGSEVPIPATLTDALARRLSRLEPRAEDPLLVTAAVSQPTLALLQSVLPRFALSDLDGAERAGIVEVSAGRVRFTHPLLASTHYANAPAARRRELHRLLAEVLDDEEQRAHHLAQGAEAPDRGAGAGGGAHH